MMRVLHSIFLIMLFSSAQAQVKTITIKKTEPYDTQHVTLTFVNAGPIMPRYPNGKNYFEVNVAKAYSKIVIRENADIPSKNGGKIEYKPDEYDSVFYEGAALAKARFVNVKTYCDTDGSIIILSQDMNDA